MAAIEPTDSIDITDGVNPDSVAASVRRSPVSVLRIRNGTVAPDYSKNGADVTVLGDPDDDGADVPVYAGIADSLRNGLKRVYSAAGRPSLYAEPAPRSYDSGGTSVGTLGTPTAPAGDAGNEHSLGVAATHSVTNDGEFPLIIRPTLTVAGARFESPLATLRATIDTIVDGDTTTVTRDLFYGYGGSTTIRLPAQTVAVDGTLRVDMTLALVYRAAVTEPFELAVAGAQIIFETTEFTSTGS